MTLREGQIRRDYLIRRLAPDDWEILRDIRLEALETEPDVFGRTIEEEKDQPESPWRESLSEDDKATFVLLHKDEIVGMTGIVTDRNDPSGETAILVASYIKPAHRGQGLSKLFYESRLRWAYENTDIQKVIVGHREGNEPSRRANQAWGFKKTGTDTRQRADGIEFTEVLYELSRPDLEKLFSPNLSHRPDRNNSLNDDRSP